MSMPMETITETEALARTGFHWRGRDGVRALVCAPLEQAGFVNAFSTRTGGVSPMPHDALNLAGFNDDAAENIHENRRRFLQLFNGAWTLAATWQVHGTDICVVRDETDATRTEEQHCDALTTNAPHILVGVKTPDCVPVLLGHARIDPPRANHAQLRAAGVPPTHIHAAPLCTICRPELFFSYRREKKLYGRTGRLLSVIGRDDN